LQRIYNTVVETNLVYKEPLPPESATVGIDGDEGQDAEALAEEKAAFEERLAAVGTLCVLLSKASGLDSADLNGKSDPYVVLLCAEHKAKSTIKPKTLSPVWNEDFSFAGTLQSFVTSGLMVKVYDCDNPLKPEKDDLLGEKLVSLDSLKHQNTSELVEFLSLQVKGETKPVPKGKVMLTVTWQPPPGAEDDDMSAKLLVGDERVVRGSRPLILRERCEKNSAVLCMLPPGSRLQLHELREMSDGPVRACAWSASRTRSSELLRNSRPHAPRRPLGYPHPPFQLASSSLDGSQHGTPTGDACWSRGI